MMMMVMVRMLPYMHSCLPTRLLLLLLLLLLLFLLLLLLLMTLPCVRSHLPSLGDPAGHERRWHEQLH